MEEERFYDSLDEEYLPSVNSNLEISKPKQIKKSKIPVYTGRIRPSTARDSSTATSTEEVKQIGSSNNPLLPRNCLPPEEKCTQRSNPERSKLVTDVKESLLQRETQRRTYAGIYQAHKINKQCFVDSFNREPFEQSSVHMHSSSSRSLSNKSQQLSGINIVNIILLLYLSIYISLTYDL